MNPRHLGHLIATFGMGMIFGILLMNHVSHVELGPVVPVAVAARNLRMGETITNPDADLKIVLFPKKQISCWTISNTVELKNKTLARSIQAGEPLTLRDTVSLGHGFPDGDPGPAIAWRALTIGIHHEPFGISPHLGPGCRVDIIGIHTEKRSKIFLEKVLILAVRDEGFITLLFKLDDAHKVLSHIELGGHFVVLLRKPVVDASTDSAGGQP